MRYFIETYGCQMNKAESAALEIQLAERGWTRAESSEAADLVLINTCSVRITAENRAWGRISHFAAAKRSRRFTLVVAGCMSERLGQAMRERQPAVDYVLGTFQKQAFGTVLDAIERGVVLDSVEETPAFVFPASHHEPGAFRSFVPIMHGCDNYCSYCIVPYVRGHEISRDPDAVLGELAGLADQGVREITLLGQNVNSYRWTGQGGPLDFAGLLSRVAVATRVTGIGRVRFLTSHPKDLSDATIEVLASEPVMARHVHLCVQHGSDRVLAAMNRKYTAGSYLDLVDRLRARVPGVSLSTDILVGFPGETEEDLEATLELMRRVRFVYSYMYHYNPREGTPAASMADRVPEAVKKERLARVMALQKDITRDIMRSLVGTELDVLVEDRSKRDPGELLARTDQDMMVVFPGDAGRIGSFARVRLRSLRGNTFRAEEAS